ncbi:hypothetical protein BDK51DRAFT_37687 [Blyttiomyces helicus]|uniref:Uncharacterized protein n=1 Tax=Blyttiomyces helicus TaxID=388810 RepID=A0A4P9VZQ5_9FUNG|nr:hypothetical protein BDK51DRAFT_37687 [Blyttiomyces helicus]|eukprot:RKO85309.1 hypothetical protein BDK51DRAFT_37687 [Blyttiomyces helicus]
MSDPTPPGLLGELIDVIGVILPVHVAVTLWWKAEGAAASEKRELLDSWESSMDSQKAEHAKAPHPQPLSQPTCLPFNNPTHYRPNSVPPPEGAHRWDRRPPPRARLRHPVAESRAAEHIFNTVIGRCPSSTGPWSAYGSRFIKERESGVWECSAVGAAVHINRGDVAGAIPSSLQPSSLRYISPHLFLVFFNNEVHSRRPRRRPSCHRSVIQSFRRGGAIDHDSQQSHLSQHDSQRLTMMLSLRPPIQSPFTRVAGPASIPSTINVSGRWRLQGAKQFCIASIRLNQSAENHVPTASTPGPQPSPADRPDATSDITDMARWQGSPLDPDSRCRPRSTSPHAVCLASNKPS